MKDDTRPFPIQGGYIIDKRLHVTNSSVPWWLAEIAYEYYVKRFGKSQTMERLAQRGGFGRTELLCFLRRKLPGDDGTENIG